MSRSHTWKASDGRSRRPHAKTSSRAALATRRPRLRLLPSSLELPLPHSAPPAAQSMNESSGTQCRLLLASISWLMHLIHMLPTLSREDTNTVGISRSCRAEVSAKEAAHSSRTLNAWPWRLSARDDCRKPAVLHEASLFDLDNLSSAQHLAPMTLGAPPMASIQHKRPERQAV